MTSFFVVTFFRENIFFDDVIILRNWNVTVEQIIQLHIFKFFIVVYFPGKFLNFLMTSSLLMSHQNASIFYLFLIIFYFS